jgi:DNA polymerase III gamma/tau subunit
MSIATKYRPTLFKQVIGQEPAIVALQSALKHHSSHCFLFYGDSGIGKTTLARIMASKLKCEVTEIDAATHSGAEAMRQLADNLNYLPLGDYQGRAAIVDECHRLSPTAWDSLLKAIEEPPAHVYWFFCTTSLAKVTSTVQSRCLKLQLQPVAEELLSKFIEEVAGKEGIQLQPPLRKLVAAEAAGSVRQALVNLAAVRDAKDLAAAAEILRALQDSDAVIGLCRLVCNRRQRPQWADVQRLVGALDGQDPEGVRIQIANYIGGALMRAKNEPEVQFFLSKLEWFSFDYSRGDGKAQLLRSLGACVFSD